MKRKSIMKGMSLGLAAIMTAGLLAGCGSKETSGGQDTPVQEEQTQEEQSQPASGTEAASGTDKNDPGATAASNGITLPELPDGVLKLEVSIADYQQSSEGTMIQEEWQKRGLSGMQAGYYLDKDPGCGLCGQ